MILLIGAWYNEAEYAFNFSYKVDLLIREKIINEIFTKYKLDSIENDWFLNIVIATNSQISKLEVRGPEKRKRQKMIDYGLWIPYNDVMNAPNPLEKYIQYVFESLALVFNEYGVEKKDVIDLILVVNEVILNDSSYLDQDEE
jgi:hypothetical protein